jgi:hypothetical protein
VQPDGTLLAVGQFTTAGGLVTPDKMARWNGYTWFPLDINIYRPDDPDPLPDPNINAVAAAPDGALLVGYGTTGEAISAAVNTVTNAGTASAWPVLTVTAPVNAAALIRMHQMVNLTSGEHLYFNLVLQPGEILTVDLRPDQKTVTSSFRGNVLGALVPGSTLATWRLVPGDNLVSLFVDNDTASATLTWYERHWSIDGADT